MATNPTTPVPTVHMPSWSDAASVASYLTSIVSFVAGILAMVHPGWQEPGYVQAIVPSVAGLIAAGAQIVNIMRHNTAVKTALEAGATPVK